MARVLFISSTFPDYKSCGTGIYAGYLTKALAQQGHDIHVLTTAHPDIRNTFGKVQMHKIMSTWTLRDAPILIKTLTEIRPQIIHINHPTQIAGDRWKFFINLIPSIEKSLGNAPVVTTIHEFSNNSLLGKFKVLPLILSSAAVTVTNNASKENLIKFLPQSQNKKIKVVNIGAQFDEHRPKAQRTEQRKKWDFTDNDFVIGFVGFITPPKGFENLLKALIPIMERSGNIKVLALSSWNLTKPDYRHQILKMIEQAGLSSRFIFTGYLSDEEVWDSLSAVDTVVFPFNQPIEERSSGPLRQCLYWGLPIVAFSKDLNYGEFGLKHRENIFLVPHLNIEQLRNAISELNEDSILRNKLTEGSFKLRSELSFDNISNSFSRLYSVLLR